MDVQIRGQAPKNTLFLRTHISRVRYVFLGCASFTIILVCWALLPTLELVQPLLLPSPAKVGQGLYVLVAKRELLLDVWASICRVTAGFLLAVGFALPLGLVMGSLKSAEATLQPVVEFIRYMPVPAFLPLCILWFGIGDLEKVIVIFLGTFFQLVILVADDARAVPDHLLEIGYTLGFTKLESMLKIVFPGALPRIFDHLRISFGWAWSYVVVAEIVAANQGVGFMIMQAQRYLRTSDVIGGILMIGLLGLAADWSFRIAARILFPYENSQQ